jgi:hypothetical protein
MAVCERRTVGMVARGPCLSWCSMRANALLLCFTPLSLDSEYRILAMTVCNTAPSCFSLSLSISLPIAFSSTCIGTMIATVSSTVASGKRSQQCHQACGRKSVIRHVGVFLVLICAATCYYALEDMLKGVAQEECSPAAAARAHPCPRQTRCRTLACHRHSYTLHPRTPFVPTCLSPQHSPT